MSNTYLSEGNQIVFKEKFKDILMDFIVDYDENKWSNDDIYEKYSNKLLEEFNITLSDLEAKLAESEKQNKDLEDDHNKLIDQYDEQYNDLCKEIQFHSSARERFVKKVKELEQQLAEKEKELHYKTAECEKWKADYENCSKLEKLMSKEHQYCLDNWRASEQDKISFCIEQLKFLKNEIGMMGHIPNYTVLPERELICRFDVFRLIDNQIEELKKEMK